VLVAQCPQVKLANAGRVADEFDYYGQVELAPDRRPGKGSQAALEAAGASLADVVQWTVLMAEDADLNAAYQAIGPRLAGAGAPPL
jgi:enamine deaminase RidA (YjgF/YER057c/UK114 family)